MSMFLYNIRFGLYRDTTLGKKLWASEFLSEFILSISFTMSLDSDRRAPNKRSLLRVENLRMTWSSNISPGSGKSGDKDMDDKAEVLNIQSLVHQVSMVIQYPPEGTFGLVGVGSREIFLWRICIYSNHEVVGSNSM